MSFKVVHSCFADVLSSPLGKWVIQARSRVDLEDAPFSLSHRPQLLSSVVLPPQSISKGPVFSSAASAKVSLLPVCRLPKHPRDEQCLWSLLLPWRPEAGRGTYPETSGPLLASHSVVSDHLHRSLGLVTQADCQLLHSPQGSGPRGAPRPRHL